MKDSQKFTFFQILKCVDTLEAATILEKIGNRLDVGLRIILFWNIRILPDGIYADNVSGFDCYLPFNEQRDYMIKQWMKERL